MSDEAPSQPIDFSALDPSRNQVRWEKTVQGLVAKAHAEHRKRLAVERELLHWARPVLAVAAACCLLVWSAGYFAGGKRSGAAAAQASAQAPALRLSTWAANDQIPETSELFGILGEEP